MSCGDLFDRLIQNISISDQNAAAISSAYSSIIVRLNKDWWDSDADDQHRLQVGSAGRNTAIDGISDLDMVFELPTDVLDQYKRHEGNGPSQLLQAVRTSLQTRYPDKDIRADGQVVVIPFANFDVEVLPAFRNDDGSYTYGDTNDGGSWKRSDPRAEIAAMDKLNKETGYSLKRACKMLRAWKNHCGVAISGWLIDTLVYNFFTQTAKYRSGDFDEYEQLSLSLFSYLGGLEHQDYWLAPGSGMRVPGAKFQAKARKAAVKCADALKLGSAREKAAIWKDIFGPEFPSRATLAKDAALAESESDRGPQEQFVEDMFPIDIRYDLQLDCEIKQQNAALELLSRYVGRRLLPGRKLRFYVNAANVPKPYKLYWKVRNVGPEAVRRDCIRGDIVEDTGKLEKPESTNFFGDHYVEAYAVRNGVCVARAHIEVPIE